MLRIKNSVSLESLADEMIENIREVWKNPFDAPVIVFPDSKMAQWFKFRWLEKNSALANFNVKSLDKYIFEHLISENEDYNLLSADLLRNVIIAYLEKEIEKNQDNGIFDEIKNYLYDEKKAAACDDDSENKELNYGRMFDFAETLADIFLEYELTRPADFIADDKNGIIDCWINNKPFFFVDKKTNEKAVIKEEWQRKIYFDIFSENGFLQDINENLKDDDEIFDTYITLPQLFRKKYSNHSNCSTAVFIFGFDSMEQFYRNAIKYLALKDDIYLYITNPFENSSDKILNELLNYWGDRGKKNINLWGKIIPKGFKIPLNPPLQKGVKTSNEDSTVVISAPSKLREVEILHSNICKLLLEKKAEIKDIIVASPDLDSYRSVIYQVFSQSVEIGDEEKKTNKAALNLPFTFADSCENESLTYLALKRLFSIKGKGYLTRPDFFDLVRNPVVQAARGIVQEEISSWEGWVSALEVYRDRELEGGVIEKNWLAGVKSLLLAKLTNQDIVVSGLPRHRLLCNQPPQSLRDSSPINVGASSYSNDSIEEPQGITISPFSDIASSDNESLCRFIDCIDDIEDLFNYSEISSENLDEVFNKIEKWLLMDKTPNGLGNEKYIFQKLIKSKEELKWQIASGAEFIPWIIFSKTLLNAASKAKNNSGNLFVNGITFMNLVPNRVIPIKYMFMLGIDEKSFPRRDFYNSLDLRKEKPFDSDELNSEKDKYTFLNQFLNVKESLYISYVNKDLQRDEDFYPSSVIDDLSRVFAKFGKKLKRIEYSNSENREWNELFTQSALRNKETYEKMSNNTGLPSHLEMALNSSFSSDDANKVYPEKISVYQLRSFLEEPFKARIGRILYSEDDEADEEKIEFEPIEINNLEQSKIKKQLVLFGLENKYNFNDSNQNDEFENKFDEIVAKQSIEFPLRKFGEKVRKELIDLSKEYIDHIRDIYRYEDGYNYKSMDLSVNIEFPLDSLDNKKFIWNLSGTANIIAEKDNEVHVIDLVKSNIKPYSYLNSYILALLYLANSNNSNIVFVDLFNEGLHDSVIINIEPERACSILNDIYKKIFVDNYHKALPISLFNVEELDYKAYVGKFDDDYGPWSYFSARKLFDIRDEEISGFTEVNFDNEWKTEKEEQLDLFPGELRVKIVGVKK